MKLIQVFYELFRSDIVWLKEHKNDNLHAIDREIRLCFEDHPCIWLSWSSEPREFCVGYSLQPNLAGQIDTIFDMTHSLIWQRFIGKEITLNYRETEHALLEITDCIDSVWCWAEGSFGADVLHISTQFPAPIK